MLDTSLGHICTKLQIGERCGWNGRALAIFRGFQRTCPTLKGRWKGFSERNRAGVVLLCYNYALLTLSTADRVENGLGHNSEVYGPRTQPQEQYPPTTF